MTTTHECGGTILIGGSGETRHSYCDTCSAYAYDGADVPSGTDNEANRSAWIMGDDRSPPG